MVTATSIRFFKKDAIFKHPVIQPSFAREKELFLLLQCSMPFVSYPHQIHSDPACEVLAAVANKHNWKVAWKLALAASPLALKRLQLRALLQFYVSFHFPRTILFDWSEVRSSTIGFLLSEDWFTVLFNSNAVTKSRETAVRYEKPPSGNVWCSSIAEYLS